MLRRGELSVVSGLRSAQMTKLLALKVCQGRDRASPQTKKDRNPKTTGIQRILENPLTRTLGSAPGLLVLLGPPGLLLFERFWRGWMGINLPLNSSASSTGGFLSSELLLGVVFACTAYLLGVFAYTGVLRFRVRLMSVLSYYNIRSKLAYLRCGWTRIIHAVAFWAMKRLRRDHRWRRLLDNDLDRLHHRSLTAVFEIKRKGDIWQRARRIREATQLKSVRGTIANAWIALLSDQTLSARNLMYRMVMIGVVTAALLGTMYLGIHLAKNDMMVQSDGRREYPVNRIPRDDCRTVFLGGPIGSALHNAGVPVMRGFPCGRVAFSKAHDMVAPSLLDVSLINAPEDVQVSKEVFHLGRYDDWAVFAPVDDPGSRIPVKAALVRQFPVEVPAEWRWMDQKKHTNHIITALAWIATRPAAIWLAFRPDPTLAPGILPEQRNLPVSVEEPEVTVSNFEIRPSDLTTVEVLAPRFLMMPRSLNGPTPEIAALRQATDDLTETTAALRETGVGLAVATQDLARVSGSLAAAMIRPDSRHALVEQLAERFSSSGFDLCYERPDADFELAFEEGQDRPLDSGPIRNLANTLDVAPAAPPFHRLVFLRGYASGTGSSAANAVLADRRADMVKRMLIAEMFGISGQEADTEGHMRLAEDNITVVAYGSGETHDPIPGDPQVSPRRVEVRVCGASQAPIPSTLID